jgi:hypothetical protein
MYVAGLILILNKVKVAEEFQKNCAESESDPALFQPSCAVLPLVQCSWIFHLQGTIPAGEREANCR